MLNIAIVEDEWQCAEDLENCLKTYSAEYGTEFNIRRYSRGAEFLFNSRSGFDIVFMDVEMPGMNGFQIAGELRKEDCGKHVKLCGWVARRRNLGSIVFIDLRDRYGITQITFDESHADLVKDVRNEYVRMAQTVIHGVLS